MVDLKVEVVAPPNGAVPMLEAMDEDSRWVIGRATYNFVKRAMRNPVYREMIQKRAAEIRAERELREAAKGACDGG